MTTTTKRLQAALWFGSPSESTIAQFMGTTEPPVGKACTVCGRTIEAGDAGICGQSVQQQGGFKARPTDFVVHVGCLAPSAARPRRPGAADKRKAPAPAVSRKYRDWRDAHDGARPPFPQADLDELREQRIAVQRGLAEIEDQRQDGAPPLEVSLRRLNLQQALTELNDEIEAAEGCYDRVGNQAVTALEEVVLARIRSKAAVLALGELLPGFSERYGATFDELSKRDFDPLLFDAKHSTWATIDAYPQWQRDVGEPLYGIQDEPPSAADNAPKPTGTTPRQPEV